MDGYREFWNRIFFGESEFVGTSDIQSYWLRISLVVGVFALAGIASARARWLPAIVSVFLIAVYVVSVGPFMFWAGRCGGCGASFSYDSARSYEAVLIRQWWGGLIAMAIAATWVGALAGRRLGAPD